MSPAAGTRPMSDTGFSSAWLDLREPADHDARDQRLLTLAAACARKGQVIVDLGSGTGSTARAFAGLVPGCTWRFLDGDPSLLEIAADRHPGSEQVVADLRDVDALPLDGAGLVTASALLDLMPEDWMEALAQRLKAANVSLYAALNFNGQMAWTPALPEDMSITASFNQHQLTDKGIGPAAGPASATAALKLFRKSGFDVQSAESPWTLNDRHPALHSELLAGIARAAAEVGNASASRWLDVRRKAVRQSSIVVGHTDLLAVPR
jgi:SAM-dependent methyltransferase